ncbi:MAG TPA: ATP-dependent DNA helicase RecG [Actinomycetota bacterium]|nr:ATP-dependent DNA helicase RecG [Actinomycetota bacterium]
MGILLYAPPDQHASVRFVTGIGPKWADALASSKFAIESVQDLLQHYPRRHLDFSEVKPIQELRVGDEVTVVGEVVKVAAPPPQSKGRPRRNFPLKVTISQGTSKITLVFFNQPWRAQQLRVGTVVAAKGKVGIFGSNKQITAPLVDVIRESEEVVKIVPIYPATAELHTAKLRTFVRAALDQFSPLDEPLPAALRMRHGLMDRTKAMNLYHFPDQMRDMYVARKRLVFDELFTLQVGLAYRKKRLARETIGISHKVEAELAGRFIESLPFELTTAQCRAVEELEQDMASSVPMNRLLQGEVGSGKTVVALYAALLAVQGGYQAAIMAPTEVLASQHYLTTTKLLEDAGGGGGGTGQLGLFGGPTVVLLTGSLPAKARREAAEKIADGSADIVIGTHALIQEGVEFSNLGFAVVDEQHRFGVHQRIALREKTGAGVTPDVLIMTATPIPRTLALTLYGDLEVSVLDELPKGRKPITTRVLEEGERSEAYDLIRSEVVAGRQAYVITPLIDDSDKLQVKSAEAEAERLARDVFPDLRVGKMHGRMRPSEKGKVMDGFRRGEIDVLISTTVVEVGVDVPNASVMLIEDADRFGLSQLHQLRGRIGRGEHASTCLLITSMTDPDEAKVARQRLAAVEGTDDGFELANKDLELRGTGTIMGARQAGFSDLKLTHLLRDMELLLAARKEAFDVIDEDPSLERHPKIRSEMEGRFADRLEWLFHS